jgi:hypothetical protein
VNPFLSYRWIAGRCKATPVATAQITNEAAKTTVSAGFVAAGRHKALVS